MAQLRQIDHRQSHRHRARADRQLAALLPQVLSARQRGADRCRAVRRTEGARAGAKILVVDPEAQPAFGSDLHRGAGTGRRAQCHAAAHRHGGRGRRRLSRRRRLASRFSRGRGLGKRAVDGAGRPAVQGPGGNQESLQGCRQRLRLARPQPAGARRHLRAGQDRRRPRQHDRDAGGGGQQTDHRGRGEPVEGAAGAGPRTTHGRQLASRDPAERVDRLRRLAALLPAPRPVGESDRCRREPRCRPVPARQQPHGRRFRSHAQAAPRPDRCRSGARSAAQGLQRPRCREGWRNL